MQTEIPDRFAARLEVDPNREVQDEHIVAVFVEADRPFLSRKRVERAIGLSSQGTRDRLQALEERGVLASTVAGGGRVYWLASEESDWPVPPDVTVEAAPATEPSGVAALLDSVPVRLGLVGVVVLLVGAVLSTSFTLAVAYDVPLPVDPAQVLLWAVLAELAGLLLCLGAGLVWVVERTRERRAG